MVSSQLLKKVSAASGLYFGVFLVMHLFSHYSTIFGMGNAMSFIFLFRKIYQNPMFEIGLFVSLVAHMISNTMIYLQRQKMERKANVVKKDDDSKAKVDPPGSLELKGHRYTGYFLSFAVLGHVAATRIAPAFTLDDPSQYDYSFLTYAQKVLHSPLFGVYLMLFGMAGGWHLIYGTRSAITTLFLGSSVTGKPFPFALKPVAALNHLLIINAILVVCFGAYYAVDLETKEDLYKRVYSVFPI
jgi:hypothetical protein